MPSTKTLNAHENQEVDCPALEIIRKHDHMVVLRQRTLSLLIAPGGECDVTEREVLPCDVTDA